MDDLEDYEPEIADTDYVTEEYDLEFLENENETVKHELVKLQESFQKKYTRLLKLSIQMRKLKARHMIMDHLFYQGTLNQAESRKNMPKEGIIIQWK